ncbi:cytochrome c assembly protein [Oleidesulfovibrio alaskensis G20]|jgi:cytochrome c-type biogenesis protein CcmF|uniref:Cytochrome c assembly protein n=1 Tax=Oleidesulfovibrio alaskensis (strain ATCC BAA-1058 / DSM 17464 / G20) TaxID=207559 RepID=Q311X0_OLEA2|nr:cytochrome c-type biogenesis CcmF C-terminal domain-containing protein [Oleidesulfovibrio alaskensis]ABB38276.1 cytochrome c assembly protein [Oleidesulfovibrio alaskensis G20]MBG0774321.1 heme lyase CcmF/NrfE family subunit [Oleidesulfovibrio alaskensis]MBL3581215.1 heme lyase CcmF/NrfE family subunit [Oleidesulfovibrio alaskensis]
MHLTGYFILSACLLLSLTLGGLSMAQAWQGRRNALHLLEKGQILVTGLMTAASLILLYGLVIFDFSNAYIASYTDRLLPVFYRLTAFWAGQAGSLLFWALCVSLSGVYFMCTQGYRVMSDGTKTYFWLFFMIIQAFFALLLTTWSNPFITVNPAPADGNGLNPLLQNPGMIFHPPLLFLGYGGFAVPGCLALAQALNRNSGNEVSWIEAGRNMTLLAWATLTAGIILGCWWSYMELGWGGYWAWDPVENASLIPWLVASGYLHTSIVEQRRNKLHRTNIFLMALTTISAFFATYLVRSGVVDSLHAFGDGGVGAPLLVFIIAFTAISVIIPMLHKVEGARPLSGIASREGFLVIVAWVLMALSIIILLGTMWPVFSKFWSANPMGLEPAFYNRVCLPLFVMLSLLLVICPWLGWKEGLRSTKAAALAGGIFLALLAGFFVTGIRIPAALLGAASAVGAIAGIGILFATQPHLRRNRSSIAAYGVHIGLLLMVLGVAFSGPYKVEKEIEIAKGETVTLGDYAMTYKALYEGEGPGMIFIEAELEVAKNGKKIGTLHPQRRIYSKFSRNQYAEAATIPTLGDEPYATLLGISQDNKAVLRVSINPLVNWLWIGGTLASLFPFLGMRAVRSRRNNAAMVQEDAA